MLDSSGSAEVPFVDQLRGPLRATERFLISAEGDSAYWNPRSIECYGADMQPQDTARCKLTAHVSARLAKNPRPSGRVIEHGRLSILRVRN